MPMLPATEGPSKLVLCTVTWSGPVRVYQQYAPLFTSDGKSAVIGSWIIGSRAAGMGVREDDSPITGNASRFVPHYFA